ncbi:ubiquitin carboxyl-terminal hydrolase 32 isoform X2 [Anoplophora glabripennis]|uniref:ubiquitin carboxyl-terminal hydrolase 32 isoform X2 n=1 Tax=Anoplophora glabripennis TaxID=217634 RepID=UPI0008738F43|nr:ubiquitin carboxyl-terminal hydrolase 32 isoform X2 [Anoplophora glabripennis]
MGAKDSKRSCLSYEDAVKRMTDAELKRVCEAFKRLTNGGQYLSRQAFTQNVLGDGVPVTIADWLYAACGGTSRGIAFRDLICGLVLLTKGTQEEKIKFLWTLYCNESGTQIVRSEFQSALQIEGTLPPSDGSNKANPSWDRTSISLFGAGQDKVTFEEFRTWIIYNKEATVLSKWLLSNPCVSLSSDLETPTFYQTLSGVTHLEEQDICELEKCFWALQSASTTGHLDFNCLKSLVSPPVPLKACKGLFLALDVNRDDHVDFKELCCGISAACRGPMVERMKFCFKVFDMDRDCYLNTEEVQYMTQTLLFIANENKLSYATQLFHENYTQPKRDVMENARKESQKSNFETEIMKRHNKALDSLNNRLDKNGGLTQEDFLVWSVEDNSLVTPLLELLFQVCHVSLGLKPQCRHDEYEIVTGWLEREQRRGYNVGQFWYLISSEWWQQWLNYTTSPRSNLDYCSCRHEPRIPIEEGIVCDESLISNTTDYTSTSNDFNSNSMESMGDLLSRGDSCSIASSSGVSSSSGTGSKKSLGRPGPIDNTSLVKEPTFKVPTLTGEGGRLTKDITLVQGNDFELVPDSLWKALSMWYGGPLPLPRQVIRPPGRTEVELELYPLNLRILRHQSVGSTSSWGSVVGGYGAALTTAGLTSSVTAAISRRLTHTAAFSRLATVQQVTDFLCHRLSLTSEDARLWLLREHSSSLLDDDNMTLQDLNIVDGDQILLEVRNKDLTWPEELSQLTPNGGHDIGLSVERRPTICLPPGATGLHNLGNTCFMNAALQAVSNTRPLTMYFQRDAQLSELNCTNPLGTKGVVARRYAELCRELWAGSTRSVAPLKLRCCVTKHAPLLGSGGQHDSQELLAWLLDSLHEDLNRVANRQYTELNDSGGRPDEVVAEEAWQQHLATNHSIITDLFYGQLKSKVTCQVCGHESVRFDPFNLLSLPLPMESYILCEVLVVRLNGDCPVKYGVRLNSEARYLELKVQLYELCGVKPDRLLLAEVAYCQIRVLLPDESRVNSSTVTELYAYELPDVDDVAGTDEGENETEEEMGIPDSPLARSPEVSAGSALCMPNILCFKHNKKRSELGHNRPVPLKKSSISIHSGSSATSASSESSQKWPRYLIAVHRKCVRQETYFLSQQKSKPSLFGLPLLLGFDQSSNCQSLYEAVWGQVTRLLSPMPQSDQTNHATDCDDSLGYAFPFTLKAVLQGGQICAICHWTKFCRGCVLPCSDELVAEKCRGSQGTMYIAIDWDPTALHLRYQSNREKLWQEHESVANCRKLHTEPIDLDYCLKAFTSEERLEEKYHCSSCRERQPATKKLQIWRLPPILIIHLKRFDCVNTKWVKTQKVVNFPFKDFDPTAYLASVPQETILRHRQLQQEKAHRDELESSVESQPERIAEESETQANGTPSVETDEGGNGCSDVKNVSERGRPMKANDKGSAADSGKAAKSKVNERTGMIRTRLESTSLAKTPIIDEHLKDYHQHQLLPGQDPFDLRYQLYAVVSHSGLLSTGHYISYACNPNGHWYCYNDSSCREVVTDSDPTNSNKSTLSLSSKGSTGCTPLSRRKNMPRKLSTGSNNSDDSEKRERTAPLASIDTSLASSDTLAGSRSGSVSSVDKCCGSEGERAPRDSPYSSRKSLNSYRCPYGDVKVPKIDTSSAYILFYERSGLDYKPYLPRVPNGLGKQVPVEDLDENESEKQTCSIQ